MKTYTSFNPAAMKQIVAAIDCLPESYALRNEAVVKAGWEDGELIYIEWAAMTMNKVRIPTLAINGWQIAGSSDIWVERPYPEKENEGAENPLSGHWTQEDWISHEQAALHEHDL